MEKVKDILESLGYERNATEYMYNGMTGQKLRIPIFIGPTYYQRLNCAMDGCFGAADKVDALCLLAVHEVEGPEVVHGSLCLRPSAEERDFICRAPTASKSYHEMYTVHYTRRSLDL